MSTHDLNVKLTRPSVVNSSVGRTSLEERSAEKQKVGSGNSHCLSGTSTVNLQTTKNLYIRRRILLRSKSDWSSTSEDQRDTTDQRQFTSFLSLRFPTKRSEKNETDTNTEAQLCSYDLESDAVRRPADVQHPELCEKALPPNSFREATDKAAKDANISELPFEKEGTSQSHLTLFGQDISSHRSSKGIQRDVDLCDQAQAAETFSQRQSPASDHLTELPATESRRAARESVVNDPLGENAEGVLSQGNLIPFGEDSSSKASTNCQPSACSPRVLNRTLSLPSFPTSHHSCKLETEPHLISSTTAMFTSTIVSVLAPHWSGRLRRHKRGGSDVEQDIQVSGHSASSQSSHQQPFLLNQTKPAGEMFNSKLREPARTSRSAVDWQKDTTSSSHLTATFQTERPVFLDTKQQTVDNNVEFGISVPGQVPKSPLSPEFSTHKRTLRPGDQRESFSPPTSRPTTSSLLLSWRRLNSKKGNAEPTEIEKQLALSVGSLTLPSKSILRVSQPQSPLVSPDDPTKENLERLQSPEDSPVSPGGRKMEVTRRSMFLGKREFDISSRTLSDSTEKGLYSSSLSRPSQSETVRIPQHHFRESLERKCSHVENNDSVDQSIDYKSFYGSNFNSLHRTADYPCVSPKDNTNNNIESFTSHSYHISDSIIKKHSQPIETTPDLSSCLQSNTTYDNNSNKTNTSNTPSTSKSTVACYSHTSPKTTQTFVASPSAGLTSISLTQTGLSTQDSIKQTSSLCLENLSPSPTSSMGRRTFTSSLAFSPRKEPSAVEGTSPSHRWLNYLNSRQSQSNQSPSDLTCPLSPSRPLRRVHVPSIYTYLRETSPPITTRTSSALSSSSPQTPSLKLEGDQIQKEDKNIGTSRFTFDLSLVEPQDSVLAQDSCTSSVPQSLPPDFGRRTGPRLSKSPYSTLISARPTLNSTLHHLSSPPMSYQHSKSASTDSSAIPTNSPNTERGMPKDTRISGEPVGSSDKHLIVEKGQTSYVSLDTCSMLHSSLDARFTDCQATKSIPQTTHPAQSGMVIKKIPHEGLDGMFSSQCDKDNTRLNYNEHSSTQSTLTCSEAATLQEEVKTLTTHETLQAIQSMNSKKSLFSRSKKENILTLPFSSKENSTYQDVKKGETTGFKSNRLDLVLNRLKSTFNVKRSDDNDFTSRRKTKSFNQQPSELKASERNSKEERCHENQILSNPSNSHRSSGPLSGFTCKYKEHENLSNVEKCKRLADENGNQFLGRPQSPSRPKPHQINRYATMPQTRKTTLGPSSTLYSSEFASEDAHNDDVFYFPTSRKNTLVCRTENIPQENEINSQRRNLMGAHLSMSCADLMYGLDRGRSVSVSSVVSGRPSGPGRISTGSKQSSVSDLTSLDEFATKSRHSSISSPDDSPGYGVRSPSSLTVHNAYKGCAKRLPSNDRLWSPVNLETSPLYTLDTEADPTPPPSPTFSPTSRRMSQIPSSSSNGSRTSQDSLSPRGFLPSRNYKSTLSVFEESSSDTTTDDEYYINSDYDDDDYEKETEL
ncbi:mucin-3A [Colossoma macropomum]|uniref:mucin-3A n=1 Tax=Colossoma macropomum TaxID=42526 RepID=UPI001864C371|nr:mucin-3A [Colossoma macropomum]